MEISSTQIEQLRNTFLDELSAKGENGMLSQQGYIICIVVYFAIEIHPKDLNRVKNDDFWLERFLKHSKADQTKALNMLWGSVNWRKEFGTNGNLK